MSSYDESFRELTRQVAATPGKRVLVVEGSTDTDFLTWMFDKPPLVSENLPARWVVGDAGGKTAVLRMLQKKPKWVGLVDRDAMMEEELQKMQVRTPNLFLLPRYCIENYLIDPRLYDQLSRDPRFAKYASGLEEAHRHIETQYDHAIRHGSLWRAVQPLQDALQELGFSGALLRFGLPSDQEVQRVLKSWSDLMDWRRIYADYERYQAQAAAMTQGKALATWVHGKMFWRYVVGPAYGEAIGESSLERLARRLYRMMELPGDILQLITTLTRYIPRTQGEKKGEGRKADREKG